MDLEKAITTQDQLDDVLKDRLARVKQKYADYDELKANAEKYADYDQLKADLEDYKGQVDTLNSSISEMKQQHETQVNDLTSKIHSYEIGSVKTKVAFEYGLPHELIDRINGDDEESIRADAESLSKFVSRGGKTPPLRSTETKVDTKRDAARKMLAGLKGE